MNRWLVMLACLCIGGSAYAGFEGDLEPTPSLNNQASLGRHHISVGILGVFKSTSGDFEIPEYGFDGSQGSSGFLNYRYSFSDRFDLAVDMHGWLSEDDVWGVKMETFVTGFGIGGRYNIPFGDRVFPYVQLNVYNITEEVTASYLGQSLSDSKDGMGFGLNAGLEMKLGKLISIPVEFMYLNGEPADDVSGYGISAGISFNWGRVE